MSDHDAHDAHDDDLAQLARELPWDAPDPARVQALRASLLAAALGDEPPSSRWWLAGAGFVAGALAAAALLLVLRDDRAPTKIVAFTPVTPPPAIVHELAGPAPEPLRVRDGRLQAHDARVLTGDAAVDGRGHFEITASDDHLRLVRVVDGSATVRVRDQAAVFLAAGETWAPPHASHARIERVVITPPPAPAPAPVAGRSTDHHFELGWAALRADDNATAIRELALAAAGSDNDALAADSQYFEAVALVHASRDADAEAALLAYLDRAPHGSRRGRAIVMLARLVATRGDATTARRWLETVRFDPDPEVAAAAREGLRASGH